MKTFIEEVVTVLVIILFLVSLSVCWTCVVVVSWEIFLPIAIPMTALGIVFLIGKIISK